MDAKYKDRVQEFSAELAKKTGITAEQATRVFEVLGIEKLLENHAAAVALSKDTRNLRAVGLTKLEGPLVADLKFANLGIGIHDRLALIGDFSR